MNRRDFLHPRRLAQTAGNILGAVEELSTPVREERREEAALLRFSCRAMATDFEVLAPFAAPRSREAADAGFDLLDRLEEQLTVYRDTSEVSRLNQRAAVEAVAVEERLFDLLVDCERLSRETEGAFDITAGALIKAWGFHRRIGRVPTAAERRQVRERTGMRHVELDAEQHSMRFRRPGVALNLGSIGKGYALDRLAELLRDGWEIPSALLHGGHSSVYAMGSDPGDARGWTVGIRHPWESGRRLATVRLRDRGLATSAATFQHLEYNGRKLGHLLDPRTGWPAETMASATVLAPTAAEADALATAFFILGVEPTRRYCEMHPQIGALLLPAHNDALPLAFGPDRFVEA